MRQSVTICNYSVSRSLPKEHYRQENAVKKRRRKVRLNTVPNTSQRPLSTAAVDFHASFTNTPFVLYFAESSHVI